MATNAITVSLITEMLGITLTWGTWFLASIVPVGLFLLLAPYVIYKIYPPELKSLDDIKPLAQKGLKELGAVTSAEKKLFVLFLLAILGWMFGPKLPVVNLSMQVVGFVFLALVLLLDVLDWNDVMAVSYTHLVLPVIRSVREYKRQGHLMSFFAENRPRMGIQPRWDRKSLNLWGFPMVQMRCV